VRRSVSQVRHRRRTGSSSPFRGRASAQRYDPLRRFERTMPVFAVGMLSRGTRYPVIEHGLFSECRVSPRWEVRDHAPALWGERPGVSGTGGRQTTVQASEVPRASASCGQARVCHCNVWGTSPAPERTTRRTAHSRRERGQASYVGTYEENQPIRVRSGREERRRVSPATSTSRLKYNHHLGNSQGGIPRHPARR